MSKTQINAYCLTLTEYEKVNYIKATKKLMDDMFEALHDDRSLINNRPHLDRLGLFKKQNYFKHLLFKRISDILLCSSEKAYIYGGFLRDNLLHDYMANKFYGSTIDESFENYNNPKVKPETSLRTLVPQDIDVIFESVGHYHIFLENLEMNGYHIKQNYTDCNNVYGVTQETSDDDDDDIKRFKINVRSNSGIQDLSNHNIRLIDVDYADTVINIDITIKKTYSPSFDFLCNSLIISSSGFVFREQTPCFNSVDALIHSKTQELVMINEIKSQIHKMEAVVDLKKVNVLSQYRIEKMVEKGWKIMIHSRRKSFYQASIEDGDNVCAICSERFDEINIVPGVHSLLNGMKFNCCLSSYHASCLIDNIDVTSSEDDYRCIKCSKVAMQFGKGVIIEFLSKLSTTFEKILLNHLDMMHNPKQ